MPVEPRADFHDIAGVRTYVKRAGTGSPVILLHGLGASSYSWRSTLPALADKHEVFAMDLPGFGRTDKPRGFDYSFAGYAKWLRAFMDKFSIHKASFAGNSMGGVISLRMVLETPARVDRLVLLGSPVYVHNRPPILWTLNWPVVGRLLEHALGPWAVAMIAPTAFYDKSCVTPELLAEYGLSLGSRDGCAAVVSFVRGAIPPDADAWIAKYPDIHHPVLFIHGDYDGIVDRASAEKFIATIPNGKLLPIAKCGHAAQEESPEIVIPALLNFLNGNGRA